MKKLICGDSCETGNGCYTPFLPSRENLAGLRLIAFYKINVEKRGANNFICGAMRRLKFELHSRIATPLAPFPRQKLRIQTFGEQETMV